MALCFALGVLGLAACGGEPGAPTEGTAASQAAAAVTAVAAPPARVRVVATFTILGDLVRNVGGELIELHTLVGPGGDVHTFEPLPSDVRELGWADLIFELGLELETWLDDLYVSSGSGAARVVTTATITPLPFARESDEHGEFDPHVWHDVTIAMHLVERIRDALIEHDPPHAGAYRSNAVAYLAELRELDAWVRAQVADLPQSQRRLVTAHQVFGYFAHRYDFEVVGTALGAVTTEVVDPSAARFAELVDDIRAAGVNAIFAEVGSNPRLMRRLADEANVTLAARLYTGALELEGSAVDTYVKMIRYNVSTIVSALGG